MDKKEILAKNKQRSRNTLDEREQRIYNASFGVGAVVVGILCLCFSIYKALHHEMFYEDVAIITAYLCTTFLYQFKNLKKVWYLIAGIVTGIIALASVALFFMVTK
ncbi:MAG: hypothetical protein II711_04155 [Clostridia bacterium]|nr:hypothetical protein [Clostridia bacterium]